MPHVDLAFRLTGSAVPVDHGYALYGAISRRLPDFHADRAIGIHPIRGRYLGDGTLQLSAFSRLTIRLPDDRIRVVLPLAGTALDIGGCRVMVGVCEVRPLRAADALYARVATIKGFMDSIGFHAAAQRQLQQLGIAAELVVGERRILKVSGRQVVGFELTARGLGSEPSLRLQEAGLGGRRHMGCGVFVRQTAPVLTPRNRRKSDA